MIQLRLVDYDDESDNLKRQLQTKKNINVAQFSLYPIRISTVLNHINGRKKVYTLNFTDLILIDPSYSEKDSSTGEYIDGVALLEKIKYAMPDLFQKCYLLLSTEYIDASRNNDRIAKDLINRIKLHELQYITYGKNRPKVDAIYDLSKPLAVKKGVSIEEVPMDFQVSPQDLDYFNSQLDILYQLHSNCSAVYTQLSSLPLSSTNSTPTNCIDNFNLNLLTVTKNLREFCHELSQRIELLNLTSMIASKHVLPSSSDVPQHNEGEPKVEEPVGEQPSEEELEI